MTHVDVAAIAVGPELVGTPDVHAVVAKKQGLSRGLRRINDVCGLDLLGVQEAKIKPDRDAAVEAVTVAEAVALVVADGGGELAPVGVTPPHLLRGCSGKSFAGLFPIVSKSSDSMRVKARGGIPSSSWTGS